MRKKILLSLIFVLLFLSNTTSVKAQEDVLAIPSPVKDTEFICFALYTVHKNTLKLTAQFYPLNDHEDPFASLEIMQKDSTWKEVGYSKIQYPGWIATYRVDNWDDTKDHTYRVNLNDKSFLKGTIKKNPVDKDEIKVFALSCNAIHRKLNGKVVVDDKSDLVNNIKKADPDLLFFAGDQVYTHSRHYNEWLKFGRDYGEVISNTPTICLPDDHDVGQYNLWGAGGKVSKSRAGDDGGYYMPIEYVKEVERAQTSHLPDPYSSEKIGLGLSTYYTDLTWGGVGFAIIEDRKFKSGPAGLVPQKGPRPDHYASPDYNPKDLDVRDAKLLGDKQLKFLNEWGKDWTDVDMKSVLSATIFAGGASIHGKYNNRLYADLDSNGWPQTGRNKALNEIRKSFSFMIGGDQHLSTVIQHGINEWNDAGYSFCVPSTANYYLRWWQPLEKDKNDTPAPGKFLGEYVDGFDNKITLHAYANPDTLANSLHNRGEGFGIVKFKKSTREITMECWPREVDISDPNAKQYKGWPITIKQEDNYSRKPIGYLPKLIFKKENQVVQIINESTNETVYSIRVKGKTFIPKVFDDSIYTIIVGEGNSKTIYNGIKIAKNSKSKIVIK